jgi:sodium-dependent dicarboxylate transporter 2/3/5
LAYSTGLIESKDMAKTGLIIGVIGLLIVYAATLILT